MSVYSDEILFIHIPKTGGTSAKRYLWNLMPGMTGRDPWNQAVGDDPDCPLPIGHIPLRDIEGYTGRPPESFERIIATIRNPYEQQLSQWTFWRDRYARGGVHVHDIGAAKHPTLADWLQDPICDFHLWYEDRFHVDEPIRLVGSPADGYHEFGGYYRYWLEAYGRIPGNVVVLKMETMNTTLPAAVAPFVDGTPPEVPHVNGGPSLRFPAREYYTTSAVEMVEAKFKWAFEHHYDRWVP